MLQAVGPPASVADHAPAGHVAERAGRHVAVLALPGQGLHGGAQHGLLRELGVGAEGDVSVGAGAGAGAPGQHGGLGLDSADLQQEEVVVDGVRPAIRVGHCA